MDFTPQLLINNANEFRWVGIVFGPLANGFLLASTWFRRSRYINIEYVTDFQTNRHLKVLVDYLVTGGTAAVVGGVTGAAAAGGGVTGAAAAVAGGGVTGAAAAGGGVTGAAAAGGGAVGATEAG